MNDAQIIEWIAEHVNGLLVTPYGHLEVKYIDGTGHEKVHYETNESGSESPTEILKRTVAKIATL